MDISVNDFLKKAISAAEHFGFRSQANFESNLECKNCKVTVRHEAKAEDKKQDGLGGLLSGGINSYTSHKLHAIEGPVFFYRLEEAPRSGDAAISFHVFNVDKSIAEAVLIQTIRSFLSDAGLDNHVVKINSLGDSDSRTRYTRELTTFLRKRLDDLPPAARDLFREHPTAALLHLIDTGHDLALRSPSPLEYLSDPSRRHFREIVEFLDMTDTPYEIEPKLLGHYQCFNDAIFSFDLSDERGDTLADSPLLIKGGRYGTFFEKHLKKTIPAVGAVMVLRGKKQSARPPRFKSRIPMVQLIHLGFAPKIRSLLLIDELKRADILVDQDLASDSLSHQLRKAEEKGVRYAVIIGQKEYVDKTVILRDMLGKNQETIPLNALIPKLRRAEMSLVR